MRVLIIVTFLFGVVGCDATAAERPTPRDTIQSASAGSSSAGDAIVAQRIIVDPDLQKAVDSMAKGAVTNGLACGVDFNRSLGSRLGFYVYVINATTNYVRGFIRMPFEGFAQVELLDPEGKPIEKTETGKKVGWTDIQIKEYCDRLKQERAENLARHGSVSGTIAIPLMPLLPFQASDRIHILDLFDLKAEGEYTLRLRMRVAQNRPDAESKLKLHIYSLPEVTAKIRIVARDLPTEGFPNSQTNSTH